jgi:hypothetical protein
MMHFGLQDPQNSNLIRKMYHTVLLRMSREKDAMQLMQKVDAHSAHVARKVYAITSPSDDARFAHLLFIEINGDHVAFPTLDKMEQLGIAIDFVLNCGDAVDSKWAPSADADSEDNKAQYQLVVCSPEDTLAVVSQAFVPSVTSPIRFKMALQIKSRMRKHRAMPSAMLMQNVFPNGTGPSTTLLKLDAMLANKIRMWTASA